MLILFKQILSNLITIDWPGVIKATIAPFHLWRGRVWLGIYVTNKFKICVACSQLYIHLFIITNRKAYVAQGIYYMMNENKAINNCYKMSCAFLSVSLLEYYIINLTQN